MANQTSPVATGGIAASGAMIGGVLNWLCSVFHVEPPPQDVSATLGAAILVGGHYLVNFITREPK